MKIYTMGFTKKSLEQFVELLKKNNVKRLVDIRLNNSSQLSGFAKSKDLAFILKTFRIDYVSVKNLAPDESLLDAYRKDNDWDKYEKGFAELMAKRNGRKILEDILVENKEICLLCSEETAKRCHRRLVAELLKDKYEIIHI